MREELNPDVVSRYQNDNIFYSLVQALRFSGFSDSDLRDAVSMAEYLIAVDEEEEAGRPEIFRHQGP